MPSQTVRLYQGELNSAKFEHDYIKMYTVIT